jgi:peptidyl-prolyl cis-trans isomerase SurA
MDKNKIVPVLVAVLFFGVVGFFVFKGSGVKDLSKVPVEKVATVNGVDISKTAYDAQLALLTSSLKAQGIDVEAADRVAQIKTQVLNDLINNELVNQGIVSSGVKATNEEIQAQLQSIITQAGGVDAYKAELTKANMTETQLLDNISKQIAIQKYLAANVDTSKITVTDLEISQFYTEYSNAQKTASSTVKVPALKDLSEQIKQQIITNKQQILINDFLASLKAKATVDIVK